MFLVNCLAIIYRKGRVLIGRREADHFIPELTWSFPGGRPFYGELLTDSLKREVAKKTGLNIRVIGLIHARILPERPEFLLLYYAAKVTGGKESPGEKFKELRWVQPKQVIDFFTTSTDPYIRRLLSNLENSKED